jgi:hypothetical protein
LPDNDLGIIDVEIDPGGLDAVMGEDRIAADVRTTIDQDAMRRICLGYQCVRCYEKWETGAWPEYCPVCGYPVATAQREDFAHQYQGLIKLASGVTTHEVEAMKEDFMRKLRDKHPSSSEISRRM